MPLGTQTRQDRKAVEPRDAEVEHDDVGRVGAHHRERLSPVTRDARLVPLAAEVRPQRVGKVIVVLDDQDAQTQALVVDGVRDAGQGAAAARDAIWPVRSARA